MATRSNLTRRGGDIVRFDPWSEVRDMRRSMEDLFQQFVGLAPSRSFGNPTSWGNGEPNVELYETQEELVFTADLPGFDQEDVDLQVTADALHLVVTSRQATNPPSATESEPRNGSPTPSNGETSKKSEEAPASGATAIQAQTAQPQYPRTYHIQGQQRRSFSVAYSLPVEVDPDKVQATFKNGVLEVRLPKSERNRPKQVKVQLNA
jgi:HSP20 family protein